MADIGSKGGVVVAATQPNLSNTYRYMGLLLSFLVPSAETGGRLAIIQVKAAKGSEPVPHIHLNEHETYMIVRGVVEFYVEGQPQSVIANPGDTIFLPCGRAHALRYHDSDVQMIMILTAVDENPVGAEGFFRAMALGPADTLEIDDSEQHYADLSPDDVVGLEGLAQDAGLKLLSPAEIASRLPGFPGLTVTR